MAYHSDYWLLVGIAAPTLALVHAVALAPGRRPTADLLRIVARMPDGITKRRASGLAWSPWALATLGVVVSAIAFGFAIASVSPHQDHGVKVALWCLIMGVVLWLFAALIDAMAAHWLARPPTSDDQ